MAFSVITPVNLSRGEIATTLGTFRTTPASSIDLVKNIDIANNGAASAAVAVYMVPSGGSADNTNILIPNASIAQNTVFEWRGLQVLDAGATIQAISDIAGVSLTISGGNAV